MRSRESSTAAVLRAHHAVVEGGARQLVLNLSKSVDNVRSALKPIAPNLAKKIPKGEKVEVKVLSKTQLDTVYNITNIAKKGVIAITIVSVLFLAGGVALVDTALAHVGARGLGDARRLRLLHRRRRGGSADHGLVHRREHVQQRGGIGVQGDHARAVGAGRDLLRARTARRAARGLDRP